MQAGVERLTHRIDPLQPCRLEFLAELLVDQQQGLLEGVIGGLGTTRDESVEVIEDFEQADGQGCLGTGTGLLPFSRRPLSEVVELGREPQLPITGFRQFSLKALDRACGWLDGQVRIGRCGLRRPGTRQLVQGGNQRAGCSFISFIVKHLRDYLVAVVPKDNSNVRASEEGQIGRITPGRTGLYYFPFGSARSKRKRAA